MVTKRDFIMGTGSLAVIASTVGLCRGVAGADETGATPVGAQPAVGWVARVHDVDLVVYNERYADARAFAQVHAAQGIEALPMKGDAGVLWYSRLRRSGVRRIAGVGTHTDFFILHTLAREAGLRVGSSTRLPAARDHEGLLVSWTLV